MDEFVLGETVVCSIVVKDTATGALQNAATSMNITVDQLSPNPASKVTSTAMTNDSTGAYHYDCSTSSYTKGDYRVTYTATDGTRISMKTDDFRLV